MSAAWTGSDRSQLPSDVRITHSCITLVPDTRRASRNEETMLSTCQPCHAFGVQPGSCLCQIYRRLYESAESHVAGL